MFKRITEALESIAASLASIAADMKHMREEQEKMIQQADQVKERLPQQFVEIFSATKKALEGGLKGGD